MEDNHNDAMAKLLEAIEKTSRPEVWLIDDVWNNIVRLAAKLRHSESSWEQLYRETDKLLRQTSEELGKVKGRLAKAREIIIDATESGEFMDVYPRGSRTILTCMDAVQCLDLFDVVPDPGTILTLRVLQAEDGEETK